VKTVFLDSINMACLQLIRQEVDLASLSIMISPFEDFILNESMATVSFYRSRIILSQIILALCQGMINLESPNTNQICGEINKDPEIGRFLVGELKTLRLPNLPLLPELYVHIIQGTIHAPDAQACAISALVSHLQSSEWQLTSSQKIPLRDALNLGRTPDRQLWNASLGLEGILLWCNPSPEDDALLRSRRQGWLRKIEIAGQDQLEFSTRYNAAEALNMCAPQITIESDAQSQCKEHSMTLTFLSALYDQLNDDDEEIRKIAEQTASKILKEGGTGCHPICALAAREQLLELLVEQHLNPKELTKLALCRIIGKHRGLGFDIGFSPQQTFADTVVFQLERIKKSMNDLFAEEKQNLYIDEIHEAERWASVIERTTLKGLDEEWQKEALSWSQQGLEAVDRLLNHEPGSGNNLTKPADMLQALHPLGPSYNPEVLMLSSRVIILSRVLTVSITKSARGETISSVETTSVFDLRQKLQALREGVRRAGSTRAHSTLLRLLSLEPSHDSRLL
jgi:hypothetical protein